MYLQPKSSSCGFLVSHASQMVYMPADDNDNYDNDNDNDTDIAKNGDDSNHIKMIKPMIQDKYLYIVKIQRKYFCVKNVKICLLWKMC